MEVLMSEMFAANGIITIKGGEVDPDLDFDFIGSAPYLKDDYDEHDLWETLKDNERIKVLPDGDYHIFTVGNWEYVGSEDWESGRWEVDYIDLGITELIIWKSYTEEDPAPKARYGEGVPIGRFL
jgi:hypothetical protein